MAEGPGDPQRGIINPAESMRSEMARTRDALGNKIALLTEVGADILRSLTRRASDMATKTKSEAKAAGPKAAAKTTKSSPKAKAAAGAKEKAGASSAKSKSPSVKSSSKTTASKSGSSKSSASKSGSSKSKPSAPSLMAQTEKVLGDMAMGATVGAVKGAAEAVAADMDKASKSKSSKR